MTEQVTNENFYGEKEKIERSVELAVFSLGPEKYALNLSDITEIMSVPAITFVPGAEQHVLGLINYRGSVLPVIDLKKMFGIPALQASPNNRIIALKFNKISVGLFVDEVGKVASVPASKIEPPMSTLKGSAASFIKGEAEVNGSLLAILKIDKLTQPKI